jgi:KUP system potassium uptake protein
MPIGNFTQKVKDECIPRVPGTAVFLTSTLRDVPPFMIWHLTHNRALHRHVLVLTVSTRSAPWVRSTHRLNFEEIAPDFWRARARYGFMERPNIPILLQLARARGCNIDLDDVTYYVGHENVVGTRGRTPRWVEALFAFMQRNSVHVTDYFGLPLQRVVEIGRQIAI